MVISLENWNSLVVLYQHMWILFQSWNIWIVFHSIVWFLRTAFGQNAFLCPPPVQTVWRWMLKRGDCVSVTAECVKYVCYSQETQFMVGQFRAGLLCFSPVSLFYSVGNKKIEGHRQDKLYNKGQIKNYKNSEILIIHTTLTKKKIKSESWLIFASWFTWVFSGFGLNFNIWTSLLHF